jgi:hypothetical protein
MEGIVLTKSIRFFGFGSVFSWSVKKSVKKVLAFATCTCLWRWDNNAGACDEYGWEDPDDRHAVVLSRIGGVVTSLSSKTPVQELLEPVCGTGRGGRVSFHCNIEQSRPRFEQN